MILRVVTAILCLSAFGAELLLDSSTPFVRMTGPEPVGHLVVLDHAPTGSTAPPVTPDFLSAGSPSHSAVPAFTIAFVIFASVFRFVIPPIPEYEGPARLPSHRPPIG